MYEQYVRETPEKGGRPPKQRDYSVNWESVLVEDESAMVFEEDNGLFWPLPVYLVHNKSKTKADVQDRLVSFATEDGSKLVGLVLPSRCGSEVGCVKMTKTWEQNV